MNPGPQWPKRPHSVRTMKLVFLSDCLGLVGLRRKERIKGQREREAAGPCPIMLVTIVCNLPSSVKRNTELGYKVGPRLCELAPRSKRE